MVSLYCALKYGIEFEILVIPTKILGDCCQKHQNGDTVSVQDKSQLN